MKGMNKMTALKRALAVAAVLAMASTASAKKPSDSGVSGDLSPDRTSATVTVSATCDSATQGTTGTLSVYIFQSAGRLINIGIGSGTITCNNPATSQEQEITVTAVDGLAFRPGPATLLIRLTTTNTIPNAPPTVSESGSTINLHP